jgi:hypothetical protein
MHHSYFLYGSASLNVDTGMTYDPIIWQTLIVHFRLKYFYQFLEYQNFIPSVPSI